MTKFKLSISLLIYVNEIKLKIKGKKPHIGQEKNVLVILFLPADPFSNFCWSAVYSGRQTANSVTWFPCQLASSQTGLIQGTSKRSESTRREKNHDTSSLCP